MQREDSITPPRRPILKAKLLPNLRLLSHGQEVTERIDHHITHEMDGFAGTAFLKEMVDRILFGDEKVVSQRVREDTIDLFRHAAVKAAQTGFDVGNADVELRGG